MSKIHEIWKYPVAITDLQTIKMPHDSLILSVQVQGESAVLWAVINPDAKLVERHFRLVGTGHTIYCEIDTLVYVGTFQIYNGALVFHLFEQITTK